ncbi:MAG: hypothetical protein EA361_19470 [Bacteroidetes bacterium]|nr:MAG: hypothetical protein EA361_19470 [Bacteroidota bacterium]
MYYKATVLFLAINCLFIFSAIGLERENKLLDNMSLRGYIKAMPGMRLDKDFGNPEFDNLIHHRLNFRWTLPGNLNLHVEGRNRLMYNALFRDFPFADILEQDDGLVDMSWVWLDDGAWIGHTEIDRLFLDYRHNNWQFRAGRQRINWGINLVSNPNDLFNTYSFFDFDYQERPGTDAIRAQYHMGFASRLEVAFSPASEWEESTGALLWSFNRRGYDFQALAGYYRNRSALGFGWAGSIGGAGFKGEGTWFYHLEEKQNKERGNLVLATGIDYIFPNSTFGVIEFLYNGGYQPGQELLLLLNQPLRPDNIMISEYAVTLSLQHPFSPVFSGSLALMSLPDQEAFFISPSATWSVITNLDLQMVSQVFLGGKDPILKQAGSAWYISLTYSY